MANKLDPFRNIISVHWRDDNTEPVTESSEPLSEPSSEPNPGWYWYGGDTITGTCPGTRPTSAGSARGPFDTREEAEIWLLDHPEYGGSSFPCPATTEEVVFLTCLCLAHVSESDPDVLELVESAGYMDHPDFGTIGCYNSGVLCELPTE